MSVIGSKHKSKFLNILWLGLLTGTLDAIAAIAWNYNVKAAVIFKYIASGAFGKDAFAGGTGMVLWGVFFHYYIAYAFTIVFFLAYPFTIARLKNKYLTAVVYGLITWLITNLLVVPLSRIGWKPIDIGTILIATVILILTISLPVVLIADRFYSASNADRKST